MEDSVQQAVYDLESVKGLGDPEVEIGAVPGELEPVESDEPLQPVGDDPRHVR